MALTEEIRYFLTAGGADLVGYADLSEIPPDIRHQLPYGISIAVSLDPRIISEIISGPTGSYVEECLHVDKILDNLVKSSVQYLMSRGFKAEQQAVTNVTGTSYPPNLTTQLPHKTVATRAGLGWIGKCALLITKEFGAAVRLGTVLTDAKFSVHAPVDVSQCGVCSTCIDVCPAKAITGQEWQMGVSRDTLLDAYKCRDKARNLLIEMTGKEITGRTFCGMCLTACPWTQRYLHNSPR